MTAKPRPVILAVEDDPDVATALSELLDEEGYRVLLATTAADASRMVALANPHAVLVDVVLRDDESAEDLIADLHNRARVVVTSATAANRALAEKYGLPFICKPFDVDEFVALIRRVTSVPGREPF